MTVVRATLGREEALLHEMEDWEEDGRKGRKPCGSMGNQQRRAETRWMDREVGRSPLKPTPTAKSRGKASPGPSHQKPAGVLKRIPAPPRRPSQELNEDMFNPPWRGPADTDTSSPLGRSSSSRALVAKGKTAIRSSGSASHTPQRLSSSFEEAEDADEFDDEDMEEEEDMESFEEEDDLSPKDPLRIKLDRHGVPVGSHEPVVFRELQKCARELDPTLRPGWHGQQKAAKKALIE